jgi:hypothetical protein
MAEAKLSGLIDRVADADQHGTRLRGNARS